MSSQPESGVLSRPKQPSRNFRSLCEVGKKTFDMTVKYSISVASPAVQLRHCTHFRLKGDPHPTCRSCRSCNLKDVLCDVCKSLSPRMRKRILASTLSADKKALQRKNMKIRKEQMLSVSRKSPQPCHLPLQDNSASKQTTTIHSVPPKPIEEVKCEYDVIVLDSPPNEPSTKEIGSLQQTVPCLAPRELGYPANDYDEEYFFGMNIACKLRQMTPRNKALAQAEIREKLLQIEFGEPYAP